MSSCSRTAAIRPSAFREFELPGEDAIMRKEGDKLIIEPVRKLSLLEYLATLELLTKTFPKSRICRRSLSICDGIFPRREHHFRPCPPSERGGGETYREGWHCSGLTSIIVAANCATEPPRKPLQTDGTSGRRADASSCRTVEAPADATYGIIRSQVEKSGPPIGANDLFIAAHALTLGCTLVTANEREFARIEGLKCENWLR